MSECTSDGGNHLTCLLEIMFPDKAEIRQKAQNAIRQGELYRRSYGTIEIRVIV